MFWTIAGIVVLAVLVGAWIYDRRFGHDLTHRDAERFNRAQGDADVTRFNTGSYGPP
ncbi:hypothetical protein N802_16115 [Knoellia sinensis KCTC 19936]|uniref:Uncharacterized protein n=1 Tax=Knoellia sinensis KCTC 19936 TaxID=1385520 RepID=A0A0A0J6S2_9MICO|nr:hypothetical protein [Knoellia sinensis]KGN33020.1 hypothetical protein N802_16115 [Knoellia sinensis KCTC 19936]